MADINPKDIGSADELKRSFERLGQPIDEIINSIGNMFDEAEKVNNAFAQGRTRLDEMGDAISKSAAGVKRLGGNVSDVTNTMTGIAEGLRRNVIATEEQVTKIYAATSILGGTAEGLVENFANVGYEVSQIGPNLENSITYIQSVGLNAKDVMGDVASNMEQMNRYQFEGGVRGLTKMAAQASMLRFDMRDTFNFAERVLTPEGAIEVAGAFQRLGVSIGNLVDPFQLMNQSINDPSGLQDSIIKAAKQFTQFDEKTKSFKINPQGVLTLRELEVAAGLTTGSLSKAALAAAELDKRVSAINPSLNFDSPEDKQLLANMATMKGGEYVVQLRDDETGKVETKRLGDVTQEEIQKLREQQENAPKTLEEIQISQLTVMEDIKSGIDSLVARGTYGIAGASIIRGNVFGARRIQRAVSDSVDKNVPESAKITEAINETIGKMQGAFSLKNTGQISNAEFSKKIEKLGDEIKNKSLSFGEKGFETLKNILRESNEKVTGKSGIELEFKKYTSEILGMKETPKKSLTKATKTETVRPISRESFFGYQGEQSSITGTATKNTNSKVDVSGKIEFDFKNLPPGVSLTQQQLIAAMNSTEMRQYFKKLAHQNSSEDRGSGVVSYK